MLLRNAISASVLAGLRRTFALVGPRQQNSQCLGEPGRRIILDLRVETIVYQSTLEMHAFHTNTKNARYPVPY